MQMAQTSNKLRLFSKGPKLVKLHVTALKTLGALGHWLRMLGTITDNVLRPPQKPQRVSQEAGNFAQNFPALITQIIDQALISMDCSMSPPPEAVIVAGIDLMGTIGAVVMPSTFFDLERVRAMCANLTRFTASLPVDARALLYVALTQTILAPLDGAKTPDPLWQQRQPWFNELIGTEGSKFAELVQQVIANQSGALSRSSQAERCKATLTTLSEVARAVQRLPKATKDFCAPGVVLALEFATKLIQVLLEPTIALSQPANLDTAAVQTLTRALTASLSTCRDALDFLVVALDSFSKQAGAQTCETIVSQLLETAAMQKSALILTESAGGLLLVTKLVKLLTVLVEEPTKYFKKSSSTLISVSLAMGSIETPAPNDSLGDAKLSLMEAKFDLLYKVLLRFWNALDPQLELAMQPFLESFKLENLAPTQLRQNLAALEDLNRVHKLFSKEAFKQKMLPVFAQALLTAFISRSYQLLEDELLQVIYDMANVNMEAFFSTIMPAFVQHYAQTHANVQINPSQVLTALKVSTDVYSFKQNLHTFANDFRCSLKVMKK
mmetsp:Transcript_11920/g.21284  ORF Transcript_11920/g.21284 Transcript_11920/m.21284 type:complete len:554 (+) Transcript_11920:2-1663(+)